MRFYAIGTISLLGAFVFAFYIFQSDVLVSSPLLGLPSQGEFADYRGVINVQSTNGEGLSSPAEIVQDAKAVGLDFLFLSDLNPYNLDPQIDGYHGRLLVSYEPQYSYLDGRYIIFNLPKNERPADRSESDLQIAGLLSRVTKSDKDPLLAMTRPFYRGKNWQGAIPVGLDLFEIQNPRTQADRHWRESKLSSLWSFLTYPLNSKYSFLRLYQEPLEEISAWDSANEIAPLTGFAGVDATARAIPLPGYLVKFPSYQRSFEMFSNHVLLSSELTGQYTSDRKKIFAALRDGQNYFALEMLGDPKGFSFFLEERSTLHPMGSRLKLSRRQSLVIRLPSVPTSTYEIVVLKDGQKFAIFHEPVVKFPVTENGTYRTIVRVIPTFPIPDGKRWFTWIYTNPISLEN